MLGPTLFKVELAGVLFWLLSLFFVRRATRRITFVLHLIGAGLSLAAPLALARWALEAPAGPVFWVWLLGFSNGLLGAIWCARAKPQVSILPMLGFAVGGALLVVVAVLGSFRMTRMF